MSLLQPEPKWTLTAGHLALNSYLSDCGLVVEDEREFLPYTVDCYVEKLHLAFEFDGPHHSKAHDRKRDLFLFANYGLPVIRVETMDREELGSQLIAGLLDSWVDSAPLRSSFAAVGSITRLEEIQ